MPSADFEQSCPFLIHDTARLIRRRLELSIRDLELTRAKWRVLANLLAAPGSTQSELAERLEMERAPLGLALDRLEHAGWIKREPDPSDRRARRVYLLEKAEPTVALMNQRFQAVENHYLRGFEPEEVAEMLESLRIVRDALKAASAAGSAGATNAFVPAPPATEAGARIETYMTVLFECARLLTRRFDARLAELGFTRSQWLVMNTVYRNEGMRQTEIAEATEIAAAPLGKVVDALQQSGWLERRADPRDRRANRLFLTRRGHHLLDGTRQRFEMLHAAIDRPLGPRRKQALVSKLGWIRQRLLEGTPQATEPRRAGAQ